MDGQVAVGEHMVRIRPEQGAEVGYAGTDGGAAVRPRLPPPPAPAGALGALVGREDELRDAREGLGPGAPIEVVGEAGIGKTSLLRALADGHVLTGGSGRVVFLSGAGRPGEDVLQMLFESFYAFDGAKVATGADVARYLEDRRGLVVLDDADLPRQELERVMKLAPQCAFAIATDERRLWGEGGSIALHGLDEASCLALAARELGREPSEHERRSLTRLASALAGHPLRMVQAAHLMIERSRPRPDRPAPSGSAQDQFDELIALSVDGESRRLLGPLAAFPGIALESDRLTGITGVPDAGQALGRLERRGLVDVRAGGFALVGAASSALARHVQGAPWQERTLEHYAGARPPLRAEEAPAILRLLAGATDARDHATVIRLARAADAPLALGSRWGAWREALESALAASRERDDRRTEAWALHQLGSRAGCLGDAPGATALLEDALRLRERMGDEAGASLTRDNLEVLTHAGPSPPPATSPGPVPPPATAPALTDLPSPAPPPADPDAPEPTPTPPPPAAEPKPAAPAAASDPPAPSGASRLGSSSPLKRQMPSLERLELPPLKPVLAGLAALLAVVVIVMIVSGGDDDDASSPDRDGQDARQARAGAGSKPRRPRRKPQKLAAAIGPRTLQFTARVAERSKPQAVRATNRGGARITIGKVRLQGPRRAGFVTTDGCSNTKLSRGQTCLVVISFAPPRRTGAVRAATLNATLVFTDDGKGRRQAVAVRANRLPG